MICIEASQIDLMTPNLQYFSVDVGVPCSLRRPSYLIVISKLGSLSLRPSQVLHKIPPCKGWSTLDRSRGWWPFKMSLMNFTPFGVPKASLLFVAISWLLGRFDPLDGYCFLRFSLVSLFLSRWLYFFPCNWNLFRFEPNKEEERRQWPPGGSWTS